MPVQQDQFQVTPYTSTVPTVQIPPDAIEAGSRPAAPLQGNVLGKGTGALAIGDSLLKGFMMGHQQKEQKKALQAQATINAADAATESAYQQYQDALTKAGGKADDPAAKAAYDSYVQIFQAGKQAKAQFVIPEKGQKGKKAAGDSDPVKSPDDKKKKNPVSAGFNNIKDFFEANPHIIPQIALMTMQPKPQGLSAQGQEQANALQSQKLANDKAQQDAADSNMFAMYGNLTEEQKKTLPPEVRKQVFDPDPKTGIVPIDAAKNRIELREREVGRGTAREYTSPDGSRRDWFVPGRQPEGWNATAGTSGQPKEGSVEAFTTNALKGWGIDANTPPATKAAAEKFAHDWWGWRQAQTSSSTSGSTVDPQGNRTTTNATTRGAKEPQAKDYGLPDTFKMQQGIQPPPTGSQQAPAASGGITKPPTAKAATTGQGKQGITPPPQSPKTAKAGMSPPPTSAAVAGAGGGKQTALTASVTRQAVQKQQDGYGKAEAAYKKTVDDADKAFATAQAKAAQNGDPSILATAQAVRDRDKAQAVIDREKAKERVAKEYDAAVKSIGGTPGSQSQSSAQNPPPGATARVKDANGNLIGYAVNGQFVPLGQ